MPIPQPQISKTHRLSHSTLELLHRCERLYQLKRLCRSVEGLKGEEEEGSEHFSFGRAFGKGVQSYLVHQNPELAYYEAWLEYWPEIESDKKNQPRLHALLAKAFYKLDSLLLDHEVVSLSDIERGFILEIENGYYFTGFIDAVLRNRFTDRFVVLECKTTGFELLDLSPLYANSGQALGYSIALDSIVEQPLDDFDVLYLVGQLKKTHAEDQVQILRFSKTYKDRLDWFLSLALDAEKLNRMAQLSYYPKRGDSCLKFNKPCTEYGTCGLHSLDVPYVETEKERAKRIEAESLLPVFQLQTLIDEHLQRGVK